jgi:hemerythrin-like domain-containing protein
MSATIELLGGQHQEVLVRLDAVEIDLGKRGANGRQADFIAYLEREVVHHFAVEEQALFPVLARHLPLEQGPLAVMNAEHATFRDLMQELTAGLDSGDVKRQERCTRDLIELLRQHIAKEDNVLFPMASRMLTADDHCEVDSLAAVVPPFGTAV